MPEIAGKFDALDKDKDGTLTWPSSWPANKPVG